MLEMQTPGERFQNLENYWICLTAVMKVKRCSKNTFVFGLFLQFFIYFIDKISFMFPKTAKISSLSFLWLLIKVLLS